MDRKQNSIPQLFHCPTCGASLPVPDSPSVRCEYCGSNVLVPPELIPRKASEEKPVQVVFSDFATTRREVLPGTKSRSIFPGLIIGLIGICAIIGVIAAATGVFTSATIFNQTVKQISSTGAVISSPTAPRMEPTPVPTATALPMVQVELLFGGAGIGPGQFDDPRYVAVDPQGNIFVADYSDGRIQKFDQDGKFLQLINVEPDRNDNVIIRSMAADFSGRLFIVRGGDLLIYNTAEGVLAGSIPGSFPDLIHDQVVSDPANRIYALNTGGGADGLLQYDPEGNPVWVKESILEGSASKNVPLSVARIAVDGLGNLFALNILAHEIYKFDQTGAFLDRFGSKGNSEQQFNSPDAMAVDGKGNIFIADSHEGYILKVFDNNGTFLKNIPWPDELTLPRMILFDVNGDLYTVTNTSQVARMAIRPEASGD